MKTIALILGVTILVAGFVIIGNLTVGRGGGSKQDAEALELELLTILGDVQDDPNALPGRWRVAGTGEKPKPMTQEEADKLHAMMTLPYVQGSKKAPDVEDVTVYDPDRAMPGINLYTSGHAPEAFAIDMEGKVLHEWSYAIDDVWPDVPETIHSKFWRRAHWYRTGEILAIFEGIGMIKLDKASRLVWAFKGGCHHEAVVQLDGTIYVLTRRAQLLPDINPNRPVLPDAITILSPDGELEDEIPILECFENSNYKPFLKQMKRRGDLLHTNSIHISDGTGAQSFSPLSKGNILISMLKLDAIAIIDPSRRSVVWALSGTQTHLFKRQHDPTVVSNGNLLLFDNQGNGGKSKVVEFNIARREVAWQYKGTAEEPLYSRTCGTSQRLENGNTLITESDNGRALEVTKDSDVVWEFYNPHRAGEHSELIATLFEVDRVDGDYFVSLGVE